MCRQFDCVNYVVVLWLEEPNSLNNLYCLYPHNRSHGLPSFSFDRAPFPSAFAKSLGQSGIEFTNLDGVSCFLGLLLSLVLGVGGITLISSELDAALESFVCVYDLVGVDVKGNKWSDFTL